MPREPLDRAREIMRLRRQVKDYSPSVAFGTTVLEDRPEHVRLIGTCLIQWTEIETNLATLLAALLRANSDASVAVFDTLRRSTSKHETILTAAKSMLDDDSHELVCALMRYVTSLEKQRNDLAHGWFGVVDDVDDDGVAWISQSHMTSNHVMHFSRTPKIAKMIASMVENTFIYRRSHLEELLKELRTCTYIINNFRGYISKLKDQPPASFPQDVCDNLNSLPQIKRGVKPKQPPEYHI